MLLPYTVARAGLSTAHSIQSRTYFSNLAHWGMQAAEALEHAHDEGVVHRDIKPGNLLLDAKGKLWITDFGLAHCQSTGNLTLTGDLVGTVRYMSPEQACGRRMLVDHRTDIYSLGVTLYELLTLEPVFSSSDRQELLRLIANEETRPPRQFNPAIPKELETIVLKAMEKSPEGRYATAQELADDLRRFLDDKPITARRPTLVERTMRWSRRHKYLLRSAVAILMVAVLALAVGAWLLWQKERKIRTAYEAEARQRQRAEDNLALARQAVDDMYTEVAEKWLAGQPGMIQVQRQFLEKALKFYQHFGQEQSSSPAVQLDTARAYLRVGGIQSKLGAYAEAETAYRAALQIMEPLAVDLATVPDYRRLFAFGHHLLGLLLRDLGKRAEADTAYRAALKLREPLAAEFPAVPEYRLESSNSQHCLAVLLYEIRRPAEAEPAFHEARKLLERLAAEFPNVPGHRYQLAQTHTSLSLLLHDLGKSAEAETALRAALKLQERLAAEVPTEPQYRLELATTQSNLGNLLFESGRYAEAETTFQAGLKLRERLAADFPAVPEYRHLLASSHNNLGLLLQKIGRPGEAETAHRAAVQMKERLVADFPLVLDYAVGLGAAYCNLATLQRASGQPQIALEWYDKAKRTLAAVLAKDQRLATARLFLRNAHWGHAEALLQLSQYTEAIPDFDGALALADGSDHEKLRVERAVALLRAGQTARAVAEADALTQGENLQGGTLYDAACLYALASAALKDNSQQAENYAAKAIALLRRAHAAGYFEEPARIVHLKRDPDLDTLRSRGAYQRLIEELEKRQQGGPEEELTTKDTKNTK